MSTESFVETCSCGAKFVWSGNSLMALSSAKAWRDGHRHEALTDPGSPEPVSNKAENPTPTPQREANA